MLNLTAVACGRVDVLCEREPYAWNVAAGVLIVERAGVIIRGGIGEDCAFDGRSLLAYTSTIADELVWAFPRETSV